MTASKAGLAAMVGAAMSLGMAPTAPPTITYTQLSSIDPATKKCTIRPVAGKPYYDAIVAQRAAGGLIDVEVMSHVATRLGFGLAPFGSLVPPLANDCTTVFFAEELARQLTIVGTNVDSALVRTIRGGLLPNSMYSRASLDMEMTRFRNDPAAVAVSAHSVLWFKARQETELLMNLRNILGSEVLLASGKIEDHQMNLEERLDEIWINLFNVDGSKAEQYNGGSDSMIEALRRQTGSTFFSLLSAVIKHPAMLVYLDNQANAYVCSAPGVCAASNQNLARELMELHTFGIGPQTATLTTSPYTQDDVEAMASILAGYNVTPFTDPTSPGQFVYNATLAANVPITLMGTAYAATGATRLDTVLRMLANHPQTRAHICARLAQNLFAPSLVAAGRDACAAAWGTDGNLKAMYAAMLELPSFWAKTNYMALYRTPIDQTMAVARAIGVNAVDLRREVQRWAMTYMTFEPTSLTGVEWVDLNTTLKSRSVWWTFQGIHNELRNLLGVYRGEIALPIGYSDLATDVLSSAYVDAVSRTAFGIAALLDGMDADLRVDRVCRAVKDVLNASMTASGAAYTKQYYFEVPAGLALGRVVSYATLGPVTSSPYMLAPSQQSIVSAIVANRATWPYFPGHTGSETIAKAMAILALGNSREMKK